VRLSLLSGVGRQLVSGMGGGGMGKGGMVTQKVQRNRKKHQNGSKHQRGK